MAALMVPFGLKSFFGLYPESCRFLIYRAPAPPGACANAGVAAVADSSTAAARALNEIMFVSPVWIDCRRAGSAAARLNQSDIVFFFSIRLEPTKTLQGSHVGSTKPSLRPCKRGSIETGENAPSPPDRRASIRYDKVVDGIDALPDENTQARRYRNGVTRPSLQHEKGNQHSGRWWFDRGNPGIGSPRGAPTCQPQPPRFYTVWVKRRHRPATKLSLLCPHERKSAPFCERKTGSAGEWQQSFQAFLCL